MIEIRPLPRRIRPVAQRNRPLARRIQQGRWGAVLFATRSAEHGLAPEGSGVGRGGATLDAASGSLDLKMNRGRWDCRDHGR